MTAQPKSTICDDRDEAETPQQRYEDERRAWAQEIGRPYREKDCGDE